MGIDIAVCENECEAALCKVQKTTLVKVMVPADRFTDIQDFDYIVSMDDIRKATDDFEGLAKRNRINTSAEFVYLMNIKKENDAELLKPYATKLLNRWVDLRKIDDEALKEKVIAEGSTEDRIYLWSENDITVINETCEKCPLAWNKGKECIGTFGPDTSALPTIAEKYGCPIIASAKESRDNDRIFTPEEAKAVLKEVEILKPALVTEGKMAVHRYSGPLERVEAMAKVCAENNCKFRFI